MSLEAIKFNKSNPANVTVEVLDQLLLPYTTKYIPIHSIDDGYRVIKTMQVRGAPAIAIVGSLSVLLEIQLLQKESFTKSQWYYNLSNWNDVRSRFQDRLAFLLSSRPTAVNLSNALKEISTTLNKSDNIKAFDRSLFEFVKRLINDDLSNNKKMGDNGAKFLLDTLEKEGFKDEFAVLTICNTGSLATSGYGTALGVIRSLWEDSKTKSYPTNIKKKAKTTENSQSKMVHVYPLETRPYNQGSRLTAYELVQEQIPATLITDSSVAYRIQTSPVPIKAAFVGADRIVRNGDTANKIGTFQLAILCKQFGIKFFVVAPNTTIDNITQTGEDIIVEERHADEFRHVTGTAIDLNTNKPVLNEKEEPVSAKVGISPPQINVWNPAFDITTHAFIDGIVTEKGVFTKNADGEFELDKLF
ncbi:S-methyl-5-thioribose-1-phosphate isomerase MRI1 NDAI_0A04680 [Naumovozyma dairenensis CBS 421]|uniref:Methylthioribose-1-phosphate isomerase n=1 Tax=Naumovozyma dairenensis (strain ATCC 10597 / BCRC 20456 / CBS 421 / NBRC 0211 / NRRL Y-12639) TaxID=1071378 RepID=G0W486_NAUDC|nr:hypothetical protein NDAI_0A04680 [Naumovozyma dairenensis CBS 421]CCD22624.1 hypothetical protein NDAI_0A04680 [Naumovozyma dairenensis CBS 421]